MPTYEYECRNCDYVFEAFQSMSDEPLSVCPKCGGAVKRLIGGGSGIIFKGSGFYSTDSRKSSSASSVSKQHSQKAKEPETAGSAAACGCASPAHKGGEQTCSACSGGDGAKKESA